MRTSKLKLGTRLLTVAMITNEVVPVEVDEDFERWGIFDLNRYVGPDFWANKFQHGFLLCGCNPDHFKIILRSSKSSVILMGRSLKIVIKNFR